MHGSIQRRITVATNWAVTRIACLDDRELYEDSYALTEEFREWILCADDQPELILDQFPGGLIRRRGASPKLALLYRRAELDTV